MARRAAGIVFFSVAVLGVLLTACGSPSTTRQAAPVATATARPGPTPTPTIPPAPPVTLSVYYGTQHTIYALDATNGSVRWTHAVGNGVLSVAVSSGLVYAATYDHKLTALRASDGSQVWQVATHTLAFPFTLFNGLIYAGSDAFSGSDGFVDAYRASDGTQLWEYDGGHCSFDGLAVDAAGVYLSPGGCQQSLFALRASDGSVLWHSQIPSRGAGISAVSGAVYVNNYGDIYALSATNGTQIWHVHLSQVAQGGSAPGVGNSAVYVTDSSAIYALQAANGAQLWTTLGNLAVSPIVDSTAVYFIPSINTLDALNPTNGSTVWQFTKTGAFTYPTSVNGTLYVMLVPGPFASTAAYTVYALHTSDGSVLWQHSANDADATSVAVG